MLTLLLKRDYLSIKDGGQQHDPPPEGIAGAQPKGVFTWYDTRGPKSGAGDQIAPRARKLKRIDQSYPGRRNMAARKVIFIVSAAALALSTAASFAADKPKVGIVAVNQNSPTINR